MKEVKVFYNIFYKYDDKLKQDEFLLKYNYKTQNTVQSFSKLIFMPGPSLGISFLFVKRLSLEYCKLRGAVWSLLSKDLWRLGGPRQKGEVVTMEAGSMKKEEIQLRNF
jgi:hypothetical protein